MNIFKFAKTILKPKSKSNVSLDKATCERLKIYENRFSSRLKKARTVAILAFGVIFLAQFLTPVLMPAQQSMAADTSSNAVIYGGAFSVAELQQKMAQGAGPNPAGHVYAPYQDPGNLQLLFHTLGIWENQFGTLQDGTVYKDGRVFVGNTLVGNNAISSGRTDFGGTVDVTHMPGYNIYWRSPSVSFVPNSLSALVFNNGSTVYAIIKDCGNVIRANPVAPPAKSEVAIEKIERNVTKGETNWVKETKANPGDTIEYQINYATSGTNNNVFVYDALGEPTNLMNRQYLDYVSGGTYYPNGLNIRGYIAPREIVFSLGNLPSGSQGHVNFNVKVKTNTPNNTTICNSAAIISDQVNSLVSNNVCLTSTTTPPPAPPSPPKPPAPPTPPKPPAPPAPPTCEYTVSKTVSKDCSDYVESIDAKPGDYAYFKINVKNTGTANLTNLIIKDNLPSHVTYVDGSTKLYNSSHPEGISIDDKVVNGGANVGDYPAGANVYVVFKVKLNDDFASGCTTLVNQGGAHADCNCTKWDTAQIKVCQEKPPTPCFTICKTVSTDGTNYADLVNSEPGKEVYFKIYVKNTGNTTLSHLIVKDNLPSHVTYINGSTVVYNSTHPNGININDKVVDGGVDVGSYTKGADVSVVFKVKLCNDFDNGCTTLTNQGSAWAEDSCHKYDTAKVKVCVYKPAEITKSKSAINVTQDGVNAETVKSHAGDVIRYTLTTKNIGGSTEKDYVVKDNIADVLQYSDVTSTGGGTVANGEITYPAKDIAVDQTITSTFEVTIKPEKDWPIKGDLVMTNVYGNIVNVPVGFIEIVLSKAAFNETQGVDATTTPAKSGDVIKYTLTTKNTGNETKKDFVVTDDINDILIYANVTDLGGGTLASKAISWTKADIEPGKTLTKTFKITIKPDSEWPANGDLVMTNTYGNTINVPLQPPTVPTPTGVLGASTATGVKGLAVTGTALNILFGTFIMIASFYLYFRQRILLRLAMLTV